jgi:type III secretion protein J
MTALRRLAPLLAVTLLLAGCKARIQHGLDERQANELQTVLLERGLAARKVSEEGKKPSWAIEVDDEHAADAVRILAELGLPRPKTDSFNDVFGKGSLVPSATEERALYLQALSGELSRTLESMEGVTFARVHLVLPPAPRPGQPATPAKASAFLRVRPGSSERITQAREELKALVAGSVEGLSPEAVTLVVNEVSTLVSPPPVDPSPLVRLRALAIALAGAVSLLALLMVLLTLRLRHYRRALEKVLSAPILSPKPVVSPAATRKPT